MATKSSPLLCELHAHTTWSDGDLTVRELCDLYGRSGFDVLAVTDHTTRERREVHAGNHAAYLSEVVAEAEDAIAEAFAAPTGWTRDGMVSFSSAVSFRSSWTSFISFTR